MLNKREKKKTEKWGRSVYCEEEMREKKMRWVRGDVCVWWGRRKKKGGGGGGVHGWWGKKKRKWGVGFTCIVGKKGEWKRNKKKKLEREKTKLVLFVCSLCLV
jgi:hypothetical protein